MVEETTEDFENWTVCEFHGHHFVGGRCEDCGEHSEEDTQEMK